MAFTYADTAYHPNYLPITARFSPDFDLIVARLSRGCHPPLALLPAFCPLLTTSPASPPNCAFAAVGQRSSRKARGETIKPTKPL